LVQGCNNNIISNNTISCNGGTGIYVTSGAAYNDITHNTITLTNSAIDNGFGIDVQAGGYNSSFSATMLGTVMTVTGTVTGNALAVGYQIVGLGVTQSTIISFGTGSGGAGTYNMSANQTVSTSETMYATYEGIADKVSNTIAFNDIYATFLSAQSGLHAYHTGATFVKNHVRGFGNTSGQGGSGILCENLTNTLQPSTAFTWNIIGNEISDNRTGYIFHVQASAGTNNGGPCTALMLGNQDYNSTYASMQTYDGTNGYVWPGNALPGQMALQGMGTATLTAGSVTISDASITPLSRISARVLTAGGTQGALYISAQSNGSLTIKSSSASDTSTVLYATS
jgi:parallel beta-helix repeat protein